ncbi:MAG: hypothetical protein Q7S99_15025 [Parvibaculum sp.]|nr:hypothetical protein [Parvibaculum sp.]|tara:strand:+ start:985 stop:1668 length:684 start_codon:yes stop_codon:yes gene_type:complete
MIMLRVCPFSVGLLFAIALTGGAAQADTSRPQTYVIGLDLSKSNPLVRDKDYAARAAARTAKEIGALPLKSRVMLRTFGSYDASANGLKIDQVISSHARPDAVAQGIATLIANVPKLVDEGKLTAQGKTNIVPFLDTMAEVVDCRASDVHVVLLTDGFEDSEYAHLTKSGGTLPAASFPAYQGCDELLILGLGQGGGSPAATKRLREAWAGYAGSAGFERFSGLYDW